MYSSHPKAKRIEFRCPDPSCNPYLAFSAVLMAMLDGIQSKIGPGEPLEGDAYLHPHDGDRIGTTPGLLSTALDCLTADHDFLLRGDVFTEDVIQSWIDHKRTTEVEALRLRPHPFEFCMYYDV